MMKPKTRSRLATLSIVIVALMLSMMPGIASARQHTALASPVAAPVFSFPTNGTSYPSNGPYLFQLQPVSGATGYLWSFVQNGMIVYQNLAWDGHLSPASYTVATRSKAHSLIHSGDLHVWVRALMKKGTWSATGAVMVRIQGKGRPQSTPTPVSIRIGGDGGSHPKPTATPQPKATATPAPPAPGAVLYRADTSGGLDKLGASADWKHLNGMLINSGGSSGPLNIPYQPTVSNYAVDVEVQFINTDTYGGRTFSIGARLDPKGGGYWGNICQPEGSSYCGSGGAYISSGINTLGQGSYTPDDNFHTYRVEVKDNTIRFLVDGNVLVALTDNGYLDAGTIAIQSGYCELDIRSITVTAL